jgi:hypothetical protein
MNTLKTIFCGYSLLFSLALSAQEKSFPENIPYHTKIEVSSEALEKLFHASGTFTMKLAPSFTLTGSVQNRIEKTASVTLLIKTENLQGASLSLSRSLRPDGSIQYTGHLLKLHDADGMLLFEKDNHYYFIRTEQRYLVSE